MTENAQSKFWCFTLNNYSEEEYESITKLFPDVASCIVLGKEIGESGTPHIQGYIEFTKRHRLRSAKSKISNRAHVEVRRGSSDSAISYCKKDGLFELFGVPSRGSGSRTDLESLQRGLNDGANLRSISESHFGTYLRYERSIRNYIMMRRQRVSSPPIVYVYWGKTGTGKTKKVYDDNPNEDIYSWPGGPWFDGYDGENILLLDEFSGSQLSLTFMLRLLDRYPFKLPVKGGHVNLLATKIFITSNIDPNLWYPNANLEHQAALYRRLTEIVHFE